MKESIFSIPILLFVVVLGVFLKTEQTVAGRRNCGRARQGSASWECKGSFCKAWDPDARAISPLPAGPYPGPELSSPRQGSASWECKGSFCKERCSHGLPPDIYGNC